MARCYVRKYKNKLIPNTDVYEEEFGVVCITGAEGWSAQQGEISLDLRVGTENDEEVESFGNDMGQPLQSGTQSRGESSRSKRKRKDIDMVNETCAARTVILARKNEIMEQMMERQQEENSFKVSRVVDILSELPGIRKWSPFYRASLRFLLSDVVNRQGLVAFTTPEDRISYLESMIGVNLDD